MVTGGDFLSVPLSLTQTGEEPGVFYISRLDFKLTSKSSLVRPFDSQILLGVLGFTQ